MFNKFIKEIYNEADLKKDNFVLNSKEILISPIEFFVKGYNFSKSDTRFYVTMFVQPIYYPSDHIVFTYGRRLVGSHNYGDRFSLDEKDIKFTKSEIVKLISQTKMELINISTPDAFLKRFQKVELFDEPQFVDPIRHKEMMTYTSCFIRDANCEKDIEETLLLWNKSDRKELPWMQAIKENLIRLRTACANGTQKDLFQEWQNYTIKNLHLEKFYKTSSLDLK
jgi:hypothetical protein